MTGRSTLLMSRIKFCCKLPILFRHCDDAESPTSAPAWIIRIKKFPHFYHSYTYIHHRSHVILQPSRIWTFFYGQIHLTGCRTPTLSSCVCDAYIHTSTLTYMQTAVCTCLKSCRLTAMDRKFFMVLERWFTKLSSQKVIGSPWGVHRDVIGKKLK